MTRTVRILAFVLSVIAFVSSSQVNGQVTQADVDAYNAAVEVFNQRVDRYEGAAAEFNNERAAFQHAVDYYNSLPEDQRTQFQYDRIERWFNDLQLRLGQLNAEWDYIQRRGAELKAWSSRLDG